MMTILNFSQLNEKYNIYLNSNSVKAIRTQARLILIPFFQKITISGTENDSGQNYPILTNLAEKIIYKVFQNGELDISSKEEAYKIALAFVKTLQDWQKECLAIYFCTDPEIIDQLENDGSYTFLKDVPEELWVITTGKIIKESILSMYSNEEELSIHIVEELIYLQDIFSVEDINYWDATSIENANENFNSYTNSFIKLIPLPISDYEHWNKIIDSDRDGIDIVDESDHNPFY